ncbi:MAG: UvrD-helicase domain-containing protein [Oscillospiraceae bacterium]|nr:UvrD-helicase domain-containing protein [Oscillospiraceae bacterium]
MSNKTFAPTPEQQAAIDDRGGDLLVSAAAGSGKTRVLVERLMNQVEDGANLNQFLIITFTRAAAAELKGRILEEIGARLALRPSRHLRRQGALVYGADIDTIHAFCGRMIREFAHVLGISPDFRMADESETEPMLRAVLDDVLEERYARAENFPGFLELTDTVSEGRRDAVLAELALDVHAKLLSHAAPEAWAAEQLEVLDVTVLRDASETSWGASLLQEAHAAADDWLREMSAARAEFLDDEVFYAAYGASWDETVDGLARFVTGAAQGWDAAFAALPIPFSRVKSVKGEAYDGFKHLRNRCKEAIAKLTAPFDLPSSELFEDMEAVRPVICALAELVLDAEQAYQREKTRRGVLDFSDLEHLAIRLLTDAETGVAAELAERYREIMVDEFQDVSGIQDTIFRALGAEGSRLFMVGDVKQSIYRFRLADPLIFLGYYRNFPNHADARDGGPRRVLLSKNFRSRPGVLDAVNFLFWRIMSVEFGEMEYGDSEALYAGLEDASDEPAAELDILDRKPLEKDGTDARDMAEARHVAARILALHKETGYAWGDFAILLRSLKNKAPRFEKALEELGIPVAKSGGEGFFYTAEIASFLSLLTVVLNPLQDVPLIGVLRSPLFGFSPDELAEIRLVDRGVSFFEAMEMMADSVGCDAHIAPSTVSVGSNRSMWASTPTGGRCKTFLADLARWRDTAPDLTVEQFLWYLVHETNALSVFGSMPQGEARRQNLLTFLAYARGAASHGGRSLFDFVTGLEKRLESGDPPKLATAHGGGDAVTIMSVHKSKGLEFPVVVLPDLAKRFQLSDTTAQVLVHPTLGLGSVRRDLTRKIRYPTLPQIAIAHRLRQESLAEELRILYVAMTRAKRRLIMTVTLDNADKTMDDLQAMASGSVSPYVLAAQSSAAPWVLLPTLAVSEPPWTVRRVTCGVETGVGGDAHIVSSAAERVDAGGRMPPLQGFSYPYPEAIDLPSKLTATELKGRKRDSEVQAEAEGYQQAKRPVLFRRPGFIEAERPLTAAERGTATHLVMQYIDFARCTSLAGVEAEVVRLHREGRITAQAAEAVDAASIWRFFESPLGQRIRDAKNLQREFKFSLLVPAADLFGAGGDEQVLLQGVVDCYLEEPDGLVVVDFKTDYVPPDGLEAKAQAYAPQMEAYAYALERITGKAVKEMSLYFFGPGERVTL